MICLTACERGLMKASSCTLARAQSLVNAVFVKYDHKTYK